MRIEAIFGGVLALMVLAVAVYALTGRGGPLPGSGPDPITLPVVGEPRPDPAFCTCYNDAFDLAGSNVGVMSAQYRSGLERCRARFDDDGRDAWTAGWNARLSARSHEASCRGWLQRGPRRR